MSSVADIVAETLIKEISDAYGRKTLKFYPQIATVTLTSLSDAFRNSYILAKNKFNNGTWPEADDLMEDGTFNEAASEAMAALSEYLNRPRTHGKVKVYQSGKSLTWWMPKQIAEYYRILKRVGIKVVSDRVNDPSFIGAGQAFAMVTPTGGGYQEARAISPALEMGANIQILHKTTVGMGRSAAIMKALTKFTNKGNLAKFMAINESTELTDWLGPVVVNFNMGLTKDDVVRIVPKKAIKVELGYADINIEPEDFRFLKEPLKQMLSKMERDGVFLKAFTQLKTADTIRAKVANALVDILAKPANIDVVARDTLVAAEMDKGSAIATGRSPVRHVPATAVALEKTMGDVKKNRNTEAKENALILAHLNRRLPDIIAENMKEPRLVWRTGNFVDNVHVMVERTPEQRLPRIKYTYEKTPYGVFDKEIGARPWQTPERDPRDLIEMSIKEAMREKQLARFTIRRAN